MFFILSKIFYFITVPLFWIFTLLIITCFQKSHKRKSRMLLFSVVLLYLFSNEFIFNEVVRHWEVPAKKYEDVIIHDIGIVLGGVTDYDEKYGRMQVHKSFDRVIQGIELYKKGRVRKLFISGGSGSLAFPDIKEAKCIKDYLITAGIPENHIIIETESRNTRENALFTSKELKKQGLENASLLLITSGSHMLRAQACFEHTGLKTSSFSADRLAGPARNQIDYLFIPNPEVLFNWNRIIHEWFGYMVYYLAGFI